MTPSPAEDLGPLVEGLVGGGDDGALLVAIADQLEGEAGPLSVHGQVAQLVQHQGVQLAQVTEATAQGAV
jgi:hypothetical protein